MHRAVLTAAALFASTSAAAQQYEITSIFGTEFAGDTIYRAQPGQPVESFTLSAPGFSRFNGIGWDRLAGRLAFIAQLASTTSVGAIDGDFDPASQTILSGATAAPAIGMDVDPVSGRVYWFEIGATGLGEIRSVGRNGNNPRVEATSVPNCLSIEIDAERGVYLGLTSSGIISGQLDDSGAFTSQPLLLNPIGSSFSLPMDIDPVTGDFIWVENGLVPGTTDALVSVFRSTNAFENISPVVSFAATSPFGETIVGAGAAVINDQIALMTTKTSILGVTRTITVYDLTTGAEQFFVGDLPMQLDDIEIDYTIPVIAIQPEGALIDAGDTATLSLTPGNPNSTFQWFRDGAPLADGARVFGASTDTLVITDALVTDSDGYTCLVGAPSGEQQESQLTLVVVRGNPIPDCPADQNFDGILSPADFNGWIINYNAGCP